MKVVNGEELENTIISNKIIMDLVLEYTKNMKNRNQILNLINHIRLKNRIYLLFELLELNRITQIKYYNNTYKRS